MSLDEIKRMFIDKEDSDLDIRELQQKLQGLEKEIIEIIDLINKKNLDKDDLIKKNLSHESISLIQSLLILLI